MGDLGQIAQNRFRFSSATNHRRLLLSFLLLVTHAVRGGANPLSYPAGLLDEQERARLVRTLLRARDKQEGRDEIFEGEEQHHRCNLCMETTDNAQWFRGNRDELLAVCPSCRNMATKHFTPNE